MELKKDQQKHDRDVQLIQNLVKNQKKTLSLAKNPCLSNTTRNSCYKNKTYQLNCAHLNKVISIDKEQNLATVEPGITIRELCKVTLRHGLIPLVVPEFETITVGGAIMGAAIESSSYFHGQFNDTCVEYHLILGNGQLVKATADHNNDLFYGISGSYGSLGILTQVKLRLTSATSHVIVKKHNFSQAHEAFDFLKNISNEIDFVEGIVVNQEKIIIITGKKIQINSSIKLPLYNQKNYFHTWFYQHITSDNVQEELMPFEDYLFRHDRGAFWMGRYMLKFSLIFQTLIRYKLPQLKNKINQNSLNIKENTHPSLLFRLLFNWAFKSKFLYKLWHRVPKEISERLFMVQDFYIPYPTIEEAFQNFCEKSGIFPIWLCPVKSTSTPQIISPHYLNKDRNYFSHFLNVGLYGIPKPLKNVPSLTKELEIDVDKFGGRKMLYSHSYFSKDFYNKIYDTEYYFFLRKKYHAEAFRTLYQKIIN